MNISAAQACRRWPDESFAPTLAELRARARDARIVIVGLEQDRASVARLAASIGGSTVIPALRELFALVATCNLVVTPDTGVTHIAAAFERPTLALMRRRKEYERWVPYRTPGVNVFGPTETQLSDLPVAAVVIALDSALAIAGVVDRRGAELWWRGGTGRTRRGQSGSGVAPSRAILCEWRSLHPSWRHSERRSPAAIASSA